MKLTVELIKEYIATCNDMLHQCFEDYGYDDEPSFVEIKISRARSFWGQVTSLGGGLYVLKISSIFEELPDEETFRKRLTSCVAHEIIHTLKGCMNHGKNFKARCDAFNKMFPGYDLQRCTSSAKYGIVRPVREYKWTLKCEDCGKEWNFRRLPKYRTNYKCPYCSKSNFSLNKV